VGIQSTGIQSTFLQRGSTFGIALLSTLALSPSLAEVATEPNELELRES